MKQLELLSRFGLTNTEAKIYIEGLKFAKTGAKELSKATGIKRPTIYHALETLGAKGLVAKFGSGARSTFTMTNPERLATLIDQQAAILEERKKTLHELLPLLPTSKAHEVNDQVIAYEGIEGMKLVVEEALYCKSRKWDIIAPRKNFFSEFDKDYAKYFLNTRRRRNITARSLWEKNDDGKKLTPSSKQLTPEDLKTRNPRYLPNQSGKKFQAVIIMFDNKIAILSSYKRKFAILIESDEIVEVMSLMFEGLWSNSESYEKK